jgi:deoxycytidine triphosphate deaminase
MPKILPDREIGKLLGTVILGGAAECVRTTSYEVRLGSRAKFDSTGEELEIKPGFFLEIQPGELVIVASLEKLDFSRDTLKALNRLGLVGFITPTTTMMREGFLFASTKVDPGFCGTLNWGIRNSSIKAVQLEHGERLFKLTLFELQPDEVPDKVYGEDRQRDYYQNTDGIRDSARMIPVQIADSRILRRSEKKIDPKRQKGKLGLRSVT